MSQIILVFFLAVDGSGQAIKNPGFDFSAMDLFWDIHATLEADRQPTSSEWEALFSTPGYQALTKSEFSVGFFRQSFSLAFMPSKRAHLEDALQGRRGPYLKHYIQVAQERVQIAEFLDKMCAREMLPEVIRKVGEYLLPRHIQGHPNVAFVVFANDGRGYDPIVIDVQSARGRDCLPFLAHEFHHWYRNHQLVVDVDSVDAEDHDLIWTLNQLQAEGIADHIDKRSWILGEIDPPYHAYAQRYMEYLEKTPQLLVKLNQQLSGFAEAKGSRAAIGSEIRKAIPQSGHPTGFFMSSLILEHLGKPGLVADIGNPFAFFRAYNDAAERSRPELTFSPSVMGLIDSLEQKYVVDH